MVMVADTVVSSMRVCIVERGWSTGHIGSTGVEAKLRYLRYVQLKGRLILVLLYTVQS